MSDRCHHSWAVVTHVKYECNSKDLWGIFARNIPNGEMYEQSYSNPHPDLYYKYSGGPVITLSIFH